MKLSAVCLVVFIPTWFAVASAPAAGVNRSDIERLLDAIAHVESRCDPNRVGDGGKALGVYQIHRDYWEEGTEILGVDWPHRDAIDPQKARRVVKAYLLYYGKGKSLLDMARIHNGGPRGCTKKATLCYAQKILATGRLP
jgi:hypothetical protein